MPEEKTPNSLNISDLNSSSSQDKPKPPSSQAAAAANQLYDQANQIAVSNSTGDLQAGVPVRLDVSAPLPKLNKTHDFGPIAPTISAEVTSAAGQTQSSAQENQVSRNPIEQLAHEQIVKDQYKTSAQATKNKIDSVVKPKNQLVKKFFSKRTLTYVSIGLASFAVFYLIFNFQSIMLQIDYATRKPKPEPAITVPDATQVVKAPEAQSVPPGNVIIIPKIDVNAPLVFEPSNNEQAIQIALRSGVVHYAQTGIPGQAGNAVIVGHSSMDPWSPGKYKYIFALLEKIGPGDQIQVNYEQKKYIYQVSETKVVPPTDLSVLNQSNEHTLTLITCTPVGTNWRRYIVVAKQVEPLPKAQVAIKDTAASVTPPAADLPGKSPFFLDKIKDFFKNLFGQK